MTHEIRTPAGAPVKPALSVEEYIDRYPESAQTVIALESTNQLKRVKFWLATHQTIKRGEMKRIADFMLAQGHIVQVEHDAIMA